MVQAGHKFTAFSLQRSSARVWDVCHHLLYCCLLTAVLGVEVAVGHSLITAPTVVYNSYNAFEVNENEIPKGDVL